MYLSRKTIRLSESNRRPCHFSSFTIFLTHHFPTPLPTPNTHTHTHTHTLSLSRHGAMFQLQREANLQSFPGHCGGKESTCQAEDAGSIPGLGRGRKRQPTPVPFPGKSHGQRSLVGYSPWGRKESDTTERLSTQPTAKRVLLLLTCVPVFNQPLIKADYFFLNFKLVRNVLLGSMLQMITISPFKVF